jgi:HlyD family secretion protein
MIGLQGKKKTASETVRYLSRRICPLAVVLFMVAGCTKKESAPEVQVEVQAVHPTRGPIAAHIAVDAVLSPIAQAAIAPKISAPVKKIYVHRGVRVKSGQLLVTLENSDLTAAVLDSEGSYTSAKAAYETSTRAQVPEDYQKAELDFTQAKANLDLNQSIVTSRKQLLAEGAIPGRDLDTAVAALVQAQAAYEAAKQHLESMKSVSREAALQSAQGQLASAKGKYLGAEALASYSEIRSPIDGVVTDRPVSTGETAQAGAPVITIMDTSELLAKVHISQLLAQRLQLGDAASITVPGLTDPVEAKVTLINPVLDPGSTTIEVWLLIENKKGTLKVGTPIRAFIASKQVPNALKVPQVSLLTAQDGSKSVMVIGAEGVAHKKAVEVGIQDSGEAQITSGLSPNDQVITEGAYGLDDGTKVKIATAGDDAKPDAGKSGADQ